MSRAEKLEQQIEIHKKGLQKAKERWLDVFRRGDEAISDYDLRMGYDANFYLCKVPLLANHIIWHRRQIRECERQLKQIPKQLNLF